MIPPSMIAELKRNSSGDQGRLALIDLFAEAAKPCASFDEITAELPAKARYVGPGPWIQAIRESAANK